MFLRSTIAAAVVIVVALSPARSIADTPKHYYQVVFDTTGSVEKGFKTGFGYAVYVQFEGKRLLFDLGANADTLQHNLKTAGIDLTKLDAVAISHNHFDHMTGISLIRKARPDLPIIVPPSQDFDGGKVLRLKDQLALGPNLYLIRTHTDVPTVGIADEISVLIKTASGPYLITACSHTGVPTIVDKAMQIAGRDIFFYTGGSRLKFRGKDDARKVASALRQRRVAHVSPGHCSVDHAVGQVFKEELGASYQLSRLGRIFPLQPPKR